MTQEQIYDSIETTNDLWVDFCEDAPLAWLLLFPVGWVLFLFLEIFEWDDFRGFLIGFLLLNVQFFALTIALAYFILLVQNSL